MRTANFLIAAIVATVFGTGAGTAARAQAAGPVPQDEAQAPLAPPAEPEPARGLEPFVATYEAWHEGRRAGTATMQVVREGDDGRWRVDLGVRGDRGFAGIVGLNIEQGTVFDVPGDVYRPLTQSTTRKAALFFNRRTTGIYDWHAGTAHWTGDISKARRAPVPIVHGDMSGLLINLAVIRDAEPGRELHYRFVDSGRARDHAYRAATATERVEVAGLSYEALRVERTNGGNDETILWVADGVPTPVRILQREDGEDAVDLRLIEYRTVQ
ncbi:MAG TPA: DUF3108 domain-containing protein [Luteimonas sp.]|nr:DUF3108 domain-containing protein [Luteimonas sp.]